MGQHADNRELGLRCDDAGPRKMRRRRLRGCLNRKQQNQHCLQYGWFDLECSLFMIIFVYLECNFPKNPHVRLRVGLSVGWSAVIHNFPKGREVTHHFLHYCIIIIMWLAKIIA